MKKYDAVIIGFGKGGKTLAGKLAGEGKAVALIEKSDKMYGGTCINVGCIPSKSLVRSSQMTEAKGEISFEEKAELYRTAVEEKRRVTSLLRKKNFDKLNHLEAVTIYNGTDPEVLPEAISYFRYYFTGVLAVVLYNACKSIMNALGDSRRPLYYLILSSLINIALDLLFIAGFHWGVWSAAVATTISQAISMVLCLIHLSKKGMPYQLQWRKLRFDREMLGQMVRYGLPSGVQNSVIGLANVILQSNINSFGKLAMAGYGAYSKLEGFAFLPITSFTMALTTYTGQNLGAMQYDRAKKGARFGILVSITLAELIGVGMYVFAPQLISIFTPTPEVIALGTQQARTIALFYCLLAYSHAVASVCRGAGKAFVPMTIMLATWCALRIVYITTVMHIVHEIQYIYWAYPLTWSVSSVIYFIYYHRSDWIHGFEAKEH